MKTKKWEIGDIYYFKVNDPQLEEFNNRYLIFIVADEWRTNMYKKNLPIFRVKLSEKEKLPQTKEEIENLEYIMIDFIPYARRFWGTTGHEALKDPLKYEKEHNLVFHKNKCGYLTEYQVVVDTKYTKSIPKWMTYLNHFDITPPNDEFIPFTQWNIRYIHSEDLIKKLYECYYYLNGEVLLLSKW